MAKHWRAAAALLTIATIVGTTPASSEGLTRNHDVIVEWNAILQRTVPAAAIMTPRFSSR